MGEVVNCQIMFFSIQCTGKEGITEAYKTITRPEQNSVLVKDYIDLIYKCPSELPMQILCGSTMSGGSQ